MTEAPGTDETTPRHVVDELAIRAVLARYARSVDRLDRDLLATCYHPGAVDHHGSFDGPVETFVPWVMAELAHYTMTFHLLAQTWIDFESPDRALAETYALAFHRREGGRQSENWSTGFRYVDRFERRPVMPAGEPEWRIAERWVIGDFLSVDPLENQRRFGPGVLTAASDRDIRRAEDLARQEPTT